MRRAPVAQAVALLLVTSACGPSHPERPPLGSLRVAGSPPSATVTIDDRYVGPLSLVSKQGVALPEGTHRVTVKAEGYFPEDRVVVVTRGHPIRVDAKLVAVPD